MTTRLTWPGNLRAQREADKAFARLRPKKNAATKKGRRRKRKSKANTHIRVDYYTYIKSPEWRSKTRDFRLAVGNRCEQCGATKSLQVHHKHYRTLGRERKKDVEVLCVHCHQAEHEKDGVEQTNPLDSELRSITGLK